MSYCPACRRRAAVTAETCPDCGGPLVPRPEPDPNQGELFETVELFRVPDEVTGMAVKLFLTDGGVEAGLQVMQASFYGSVLNPGGGVWGIVRVPKDQEAKARKLLETFQREFHLR